MTLGPSMLLQMQEFPGPCFNKLQSLTLPTPPLCFTFPITFVTSQYTVGFNYSFCLSSILSALKGQKYAEQVGISLVEPSL